MRVLWFICAGLATASGFACGGDDGDDPSDAGTDGGAGGTLIRAAEGGTVMSADGVFHLVVPPGALAEDTRISVRLVPASEWVEPFLEPAPGSGVYDVQPDGVAFSIPASAEFHYATPPAWARNAEGGWLVPWEWALSD